MDKLDGMSLDLELNAKGRLQAIFPECFVEGKLDIDKLLNLCGEYIDEDFEKYKFEWKGKAECYRIAQKRSTGTLRPCAEESVNFDTTKNLYIEGDNLEVLKLLQTAYFRKVKMIYIDPPYNTGNDFVYNDDFTDPIAHYKEVVGMATKSNPETMGRFHTAWLNMMWPRLRLAHNLLRDDGVCFISIDDTEVRNLRFICDEIFGEENFVEQIVWQKRTSPDARKKISAGHEYVLMYIKDRNHLDDALNLLALSDKDKGNYKNPDNDQRGPWVSSDFTAQGFRPNQMYKIVTPGGAEYEPPDGKCWKNIESVYFQQVSEGRFWFGQDGKGVPRRKTYLNERSGKNMWTWWPNSEVGHTQEATQELKGIFGLEAPMFDFPKPSRLIKRMLQITTSDSDGEIILDFFSGSATTAHAVMQLNAEDGGNRKFIMVQLPEITDVKSEASKAGYSNICEIGKERIRRAGAKVLAEWEQKQTQIAIGEQEEQTPPDIGFKVLRLDTSNLFAWDATPIREGSTEEKLLTLWDRLDKRDKTLKPDRSDLDIVYEIMLKMGIHLDYVVSEIIVGERKCYSIGVKQYETSRDCMVLVCLDFGITPEDITAFCDLAPAKIVAAEEAFADSDVMSNAHYILKDRDIEMKLL